MFSVAIFMYYLQKGASPCETCEWDEYASFLHFIVEKYTCETDLESPSC
jgi:hypothetical protein